MKAVSLALLGVALTLGAPRDGLAFGNADARVLLHLSHTEARSCMTAPLRPACADVVTAGSLYPPTLYFAHVLVTEGSASEGVGGIFFGIAYDSPATDGIGVDIFSWTLCASLELVTQTPVWPSPGGSNLVSWSDNCQTFEPGGPGTGVVANVGYFYVGAYGPSTLRIATGSRPSQPSLHNRVVVANCANQVDVIEDLANPVIPSPLGHVAFSADGTTQGYNPCADVIPVEATTWSRLKALSRDPG